MQYLHSIEYGEAGLHRAPRTVDIKRDISIRVGGGKIEHLRNQNICNIVGNLCAQNQNSVLHQPGDNVKLVAKKERYRRLYSETISPS